MARPISIEIPHALGKTEARARIEQGFGRFKSQIASAGLADFQHGWSDDRLSFSARGLGKHLTGRLEVMEKAIRIEVDLPAFLVGLADEIAGKLKKEGRLLLEKK